MRPGLARSGEAGLISLTLVNNFSYGAVIFMTDVALLDVPCRWTRYAITWRGMP